MQALGRVVQDRVRRAQLGVLFRESRFASSHLGVEATRDQAREPWRLGSRDDASSIVLVPVRIPSRSKTLRERDDQPLRVNWPNHRREPHRCRQTLGAQPLDNQTSQHQPFVTSPPLTQFCIAHSYFLQARHCRSRIARSALVRESRKRHNPADRRLRS
jgi:hypothetical protein